MYEIHQNLNEELSFRRECNRNLRLKYRIVVGQGGRLAHHGPKMQEQNITCGVVFELTEIARGENTGKVFNAVMARQVPLLIRALLHERRETRNEKIVYSVLKNLRDQFSEYMGAEHPSFDMPFDLHRIFKPPEPKPKIGESSANNSSTVKSSEPSETNTDLLQQQCCVCLFSCICNMLDDMIEGWTSPDAFSLIKDNMGRSTNVADFFARLTCILLRRNRIGEMLKCSTTNRRKMLAAYQYSLRVCPIGELCENLLPEFLVMYSHLKQIIDKRSLETRLPMNILEYTDWVFSLTLKPSEHEPTKLLYKPLDANLQQPKAVVTNRPILLVNRPDPSSGATAVNSLNPSGRGNYEKFDGRAQQPMLTKRVPDRIANALSHRTVRPSEQIRASEGTSIDDKDYHYQKIVTPAGVAYRFVNGSTAATEHNRPGARPESYRVGGGTSKVGGAPEGYRVGGAPGSYSGGGPRLKRPRPDPDASSGIHFASIPSSGSDCDDEKPPATTSSYDYGVPMDCLNVPEYGDATSSSYFGGTNGNGGSLFESTDAKFEEREIKQEEAAEEQLPLEEEEEEDLKPEPIPSTSRSGTTDCQNTFENLLHATIATDTTAARQEQEREKCRFVNCKFYGTSTELEHHKKQFHTVDNGRLQCEHCALVLYDEETFKRHLRTHNSPAGWRKCGQCNFTASNSMTLKFHMKKYHGVDSLSWTHAYT